MSENTLVAQPTLAELMGTGGPAPIADPAPPLPTPAPTPAPDPNAPPAPLDPNAPVPDPNAPDPNAPDPNAPNVGNEEEEVTVEEFLGQVAAARGLDFYDKIDYKGIDPMSVEGFRIREEALEARAILEFDQGLKAGDPRAYAYFLHRQNGGSDEDFFSVKSFVLPSLETIEESVDLQRTVYAEALRAKGNSDKQVQVLIKAAIDSGELKEEAKAAYKEINDRDQELVGRTALEHERSVKRQKADLETLDTAIKQTIKEGKDFNFTIPETDKAKFEAAFKENLFYENGQFYIMKPVTRENLSKVMETELFGFVEGKLGSLIEKQATTLSAKKFIAKAKSAEDKTKGSGGEQSTTKTLGEI